jgi:hypothetical protein
LLGSVEGWLGSQATKPSQGLVDHYLQAFQPPPPNFHKFSSVANSKKIGKICESYEKLP